MELSAGSVFGPAYIGGHEFLDLTKMAVTDGKDNVIEIEIGQVVLNKTNEEFIVCAIRAHLNGLDHNADILKHTRCVPQNLFRVPVVQSVE